MDNQNTSQDMDGDLDFKIEIGDNRDNEIGSMSSNDNKLTTKKSGGAIQSSTQQQDMVQLSDKQKKMVPKFL